MTIDSTCLSSVLALFAMEINVTKNLLTGQSTVLSTAPVPPEEVHQHAGLKVYDDGRKCVYALNSQEVISLIIIITAFVYVSKQSYKVLHK